MEIKELIQNLPNEEICRKIDELGRIVIPIIFRKNDLSNGDTVYLQIIKDCLVLSKNKEGEAVDIVTLDELGRITVKLKIREQLNWKMRDYISIWNYNGYIIFKKSENQDS